MTWSPGARAPCSLQHHARALVAEDGGKEALGAAPERVYSSVWQMPAVFDLDEHPAVLGALPGSTVSMVRGRRLRCDGCTGLMSPGQLSVFG